MNALGQTAFSEHLTRWGRSLPRPTAVLVVSAHWESAPLRVGAAAQPDTLHDFFGFPPALFELRYPAPGHPELAARVQALLGNAGLEAALDARRGLDHGAWAVLRFLFPEHDVPVVPLSLLRTDAHAQHLAVGRALAPLRDAGVLIVGSGNVVHNLRQADLRARELPVAPWAGAFDAWVREQLDGQAHAALADFALRAPHGAQAHPTPEHFAPLLVACGAAGREARVRHVYAGFEHASLSMRCVQFD
jgi:4,5-DOPA dioxygenase extradiol